MLYFVYILESLELKKRYVGMAQNVNKRLGEHNAGKTKSTKAFSPWRIIHVEEFPDRIQARAKEKYYKTAAGRRALNKLIPKK